MKVHIWRCPVNRGLWLCRRPGVAPGWANPLGMGSTPYGAYWRYCELIS